MSGAQVASRTVLATSANETVILDAPVTPAQVTALTSFVTAGGTLVAVRPDPTLDALLGVSREATLATHDGYLRIDTSSQPGTGLVADTIQYHADALQLTPAPGTRTIATLYADRTTATPYAAVTARTVGAGVAAAFAYDLPASIIAQRQGNILWENNKRDGETGPSRSSDLFVATGGVNASLTNWVDTQRIQIPQADEQQRLLTKLLTSAPASTPLPKVWYLPKEHRVVMVVTGDAHNSTRIKRRIERMDDLSGAGCVLADWECIRGSWYVFTNHLDQGGVPLTDAEVAAYQARGFEIGLHHSTGCAMRTYAEFRTDPAWGLIPQLAAFQAAYPSLAPQRTMRTHCVAQRDWVGTQKIGREQGIRLNLDSYYWPASWVQDNPGMMTGSGFPMKLADRDGSTIDVWSANTQLTEESGQTVNMNARTLIRNARDETKQYFGAFVSNMHADDFSEAEVQNLFNVAMGEKVPMISAAQLLEWTDGRAAMQIADTTWRDSMLSFDVSDAPHNATVLVPAVLDGKRLSVVERCDGSLVTTSTSVIKGVEQAFVPVTDGRVVVSYGAVSTDLDFACTGVPTPSTDAGADDDAGGPPASGVTPPGSTTNNTTTTTTTTGGGSAARGIRTTATNRRPPFMFVQACGTIRRPCDVKSSSLGLRSVIRELADGAVVAGSGVARVEVDRKLAGDGRWRRATTTATPITVDGVVFDWRPRRFAGGLYRLRVVFPATAGHPAARSVPTYVRIVTPRFASRTAVQLLPRTRIAGCGTNLARPCRLVDGVDAIRGRTVALPAVARPAGQHATVTVFLRTHDGRWTQAKRLRVRVLRGGATWNLPAGSVERGRIYRVVTDFLAAQDVPAGRSASTYFRVDATT